LITREAVLGLEWSKWSKKCHPDHELTLPFTRMLAGPMDFTPGCFRTATVETFQPGTETPMAMGTRCHQLAMYVVYDSPLQMCVDHPDAYRGQDGLEFLKRVPTSWDSTVVVDGQVGDFIIVARKAGKDWFMGAMTDTEPREIRIPLSFLSDTLYTADIYQDRANIQLDPNGVFYRQVQVTPSNTLTCPMGPGGGFAVRFSPAPAGPVQRETEPKQIPESSAGRD